MGLNIFCFLINLNVPKKMKEIIDPPFYHGLPGEVHWKGKSSQSVAGRGFSGVHNNLV